MAKPGLVVFDLDACVWSPEMFQLPSCPNTPVRGPLLDAGEGVVGLRCGRGGATVKLFTGALAVLQELITHEEWKNTKIAAASSSLEPSYSYACLEAIEVIPGRNLASVFDFAAIGREGELSPDKKTHFNKIARDSQIPFSEMLFFDDCIWGDNVARVESVFGVPGIRTPNGLSVALWKQGLELFSKRRS